MNEVIRDFRRHYHRVKRCYAALAKTGNFGFHAQGDATSMTAKCETPDPKETVRFAVLMRRFLVPEDNLHYRKVWDALQSSEDYQVPDDCIKGIDSLIAKVEIGHGRIKVNSEELSPQKIYNIVSDAGYFSADEKATKYLESVAQVPLAGPLLLHQFYEYMLGGFSIASALFNAILVSDKTGEPTTEQQENICVYCLTTEGAFSSEEHIVAESLGNYDTVLPKGFVCDQCNNGVLSSLDETLIKFEPIAFLRVQFVPYTKAGKLPEANFQNFTIGKTGPRQMTIRPKDKTGELKTVEQLDDDLYRYNISFTGKKLNWPLVGRALFKIALGMVAMKQGRDYACSARFNYAREFIRGERTITARMLVRTKSQPHQAVQVVYLDQPNGTPFFVDLFGMSFFFNLETEPDIVLQDDVAQLGFELVSLEAPKAASASSV